MPHNPRLTVAREYLGLEHRYAETMLARIDAEDPMRREPSGAATRAALKVLRDCDWGILDENCDDIRKALTAALAVMAGESVAMEPAPGHTDLMVSPESIDAFIEKYPPPDEAPPDWTAEQREAVLTAIKGLFVGVQNSMDVLTVRRVVFDAEQKFLAAFAKAGPVWPPEDCKYPQHCCHNTVGVCADPGSGCPHAGERANG